MTTDMDAQGDVPAPTTTPGTVGTCELITSRERLAEVRAGLTGPVGVVMTMGALHEGHAALIRRARSESPCVLVTVFVNPLQFGPGEDLDKYPRSLQDDLLLCAREGADAVFAPSVDEMYPAGPPVVRVGAGSLGEVLEGKSRPGHFDGVLTVVAKLLGLTRADRAYFGQKDAQQLTLIRRMVQDLELGVRICAVPTVRDQDGLALSSRNAYLSAQERKSATALSAALQAGLDAAPEGAEAVRSAAQEVLAAEPGCDVDYMSLVHPRTLVEFEQDASGPALLLVAARVGSTRLIDNAPLQIGPAD